MKQEGSEVLVRKGKPQLDGNNSIAVQARNLSKRYDRDFALEQLNLTVPYGSIHGLVGPNGAGKSTALKIFSGITQPTQGVALISGFDIEDNPIKAKANIGYLPEDPCGYDAMTVREFLYFVARLHSVSWTDADKNLLKYVHTFRLEEYLDKYMGELSRGLMHRSVLCSLFVHEPSVYLLDDPFNSLDPQSSWHLRQILVEKRSKGKSVILATHMLDIAEKVCDSFTILDRGKTLIQGTLSEFRRKLGWNSLEEIFLKLTED
jgi:ABC-2 type transport system ATP-binding protein